MTAQKEQPYTAIRVEQQTRQRIRQRGHMGDTYDSLINKLIDNAEGKQS